MHGLFGDIVIVEMHFAFVGVQHANGHAEAGGFARSISPQKSNNLTGLDGKIRAINHPACAEVFDKISGFKQRHLNPALGSRWGCRLLRKESLIPPPWRDRSTLRDAAGGQ